MYKLYSVHTGYVVLYILYNVHIICSTYCTLSTYVRNIEHTAHYVVCAAKCPYSKVHIVQYSHTVVL